MEDSRKKSDVLHFSTPGRIRRLRLVWNSQRKHHESRVRLGCDDEIKRASFFGAGKCREEYAEHRELCLMPCCGGAMSVAYARNAYLREHTRTTSKEPVCGDNLEVDRA